MKVGVTGSGGFIGSHLSLLTLSDERVDLVKFDRSFFNSQDLMDLFVKECDVLIHSASVIKDSEEEFLFNENVKLTKSITESIIRTGSKIDIIFFSSVHSNSDSAYGKSKKVSEDILVELSKNEDVNLLILTLPGIFGENQKDKYNCVVPTFCSDILDGNNSLVNEGATVELLHVRHVIKICLEYILNKSKNKFEVIVPKGSIIEIKELYLLIESFGSYRKSGVIPLLRNVFEIDLFNTYRYFDVLKNGVATFDIALNSDERGVLFEVVKSKIQGQVFYSSSKAGVVRGNHYHTRKIERFCIIGGSGKISVKNLFNGDVIEIDVNGSCPKAVDIPTCYLHSLENIGEKELFSIFWANEIFDLNDTDTFYLKK